LVTVAVVIGVIVSIVSANSIVIKEVPSTTTSASTALGTPWYSSFSTMVQIVGIISGGVEEEVKLVQITENDFLEFIHNLAVEILEQRRPWVRTCKQLLGRRRV
jgi:hypothetical protein